MKKLYLTVLAFCVLAVATLFLLPNNTDSANESVKTSNKSSTPEVIADTPKLADTFLWKLEKAGSPTSYLLGTLHLGRVNEELSSSIMDAFDATTAVVTEANVMPENQELFEISMLMMDMQGSLSQKLGQGRFNQLANAVAGVAPKSALEKMRPWAALTLVMYNKPDGYSEQFGIDMLLTKKAIERGKHRVFLEQIQDSLSLFSQLPEDKVISLIGVLLDYSSEAKADTLELINLYKNNKFNEVAALLTDKEKMLKYYPEEEKEFWDGWMNQELLNKRNTNWLPILREQLELEPTLVAVGAMHLVGEDGLIEQAKQMGYTVTPVLPH